MQDRVRNSPRPELLKINRQLTTIVLVVAGAPNLPVYAGWCQARTMGMKVQIYSDEGQAIENTGEPGELVCTVPSPSQPAFFWGDHNGQRYQAAYFDKFPGTSCVVLSRRKLSD